MVRIIQESYIIYKVSGYFLKFRILDDPSNILISADCDYSSSLKVRCPSAVTTVRLLCTP